MLQIVAEPLVAIFAALTLVGTVFVALYMYIGAEVALSVVAGSVTVALTRRLWIGAPRVFALIGVGALALMSILFLVDGYLISLPTWTVILALPASFTLISLSIAILLSHTPIWFAATHTRRFAYTAIGMSLASLLNILFLTLIVPLAIFGAGALEELPRFAEGIAFGLVFAAAGTVLIGGALVPYFVARVRNSPNTTPILVLCLLFGWSVVGWVVAFVWAYQTPSVSRAAAGPSRAPAAYASTQQSGNALLLDNLSQLKEMEQQGLITPGEYAVKKSELLARL